MSTLTKEWLLKTIAELEEERDAVPGAVNEDAVMALAAMKLALASLEAEPAHMFGIGSVFKPQILSVDEVDCDNCAHYQPNVCHGVGCPAAMLQGAEPVTTAYKLRDAVEIIRNSGIEIDAEKIFAERDALNTPDCWCRTCRPVTVTDMRFVVCPDCGNKRCPHANDHRNACTGSNEPGQEGSAYPAAPQQEVK
ncbi:hypothetical protein ACMSNE_004201 [Enterobacter hormaechei]